MNMIEVAIESLLHLILMLCIARSALLQAVRVNQVLKLLKLNNL